MKKKIGPNSSLEEMLQAAVFVVEANSFERHALWKEHHAKVKWEEVLSGYMATIGKLADMPVCITVNVAYLDGQLVLFYEPCSQVVDHRMVDAWLEKHVPRKWDKGTRRAKTDANNFHMCLHAVKELNQPAPEAQAA
ncbi:hypothetical protein D3C71_24620 [compost metagenome]